MASMIYIYIYICVYIYVYVYVCTYTDILRWPQTGRARRGPAAERVEYGNYESPILRGLRVAADGRPGDVRRSLNMYHIRKKKRIPVSDKLLRREIPEDEIHR